MDGSSVQIDHVPAHHRYVARLPEGDAVLAYRVTATGMWDIISTYVPAAARGRGIGGALVHAALTQARREARQVIPTCWFVGAWLAEHPELRDVVIARSSGSA
jgi:predicted GNAT family acetyltransferase